MYRVQPLTVESNVQNKKNLLGFRDIPQAKAERTLASNLIQKYRSLNRVYPDPNFGKLKIDHQSSRAFRYHSRPISRKNRKQVSFSNHRDISATFRDCQRPSVPIDTCLELSVPSQHTSGPLGYIRGLLKTIWTHRDIVGAICLHSATIRTHQLHSGSVEDHLDPSRHRRSYLSAFSNHQD